MMEKWWLESGPVLRVSPKFDKLTLRAMIGMLPEIIDAGFSVLEVFAPYFGGVEYHGLDGIDFFAVDPAIGTMEDFVSLVRACHNIGLKITVFLNLGYVAENHPAFIKAQRDVMDGVASEETGWFLWSDDPSRCFERPLTPWFLQDANGHWVFSETAGKYYWCKWFGQNGNVRLPQVNFGDKSWCAECARIIDHWRDTGVDGFIVDAVNWYMNCDWDINRQCIINPAFACGETYLQPEGAGGFGDDPVRWLEKGGYNSVQDYSLNLWWEGSDPLGDAIRTGHPDLLESKLARYRDCVVQAGGVTYAAIGGFRKASVEERLLEIAFLLAAGEMLYFDYSFFAHEGGLSVDPSIRKLLRQQRSALALAPAGDRLRVYTDRDSCCFAMLRSWKGQRMLAIFNFSRAEQSVKVYLPGDGTYQQTLGPLGFAWIDLCVGKL